MLTDFFPYLINLKFRFPLNQYTSYYNVKVDGQTNKDAAWYYPNPSDAAKPIKDHIAFWKGVEVVK